MLVKLMGGTTYLRDFSLTNPCISIKMIHLCGKEIVVPLQLLFKLMLEEGIFLEDWKKSNVVPVHKKESKNLIKIIEQLLFLLSLVKYLKGLYSILCSITLRKTNFLQNTSHGSYLMTHALCNCINYT